MAIATGVNNRKAENTANEVVAHVVGGSSGTIEIYSGTGVVTLHNPGMANTLLGALRS